MDKKITIIGCILSVVVLLLVSYTSVVGRTPVASTGGSISPLFSIRNKRAIHQDCDKLQCEYTGKGNIWVFPTRDTAQSKLSRVVDALKRIDEQEFNTLMDFIIRRVNSEMNTNEVRTFLNQLRNTPEVSKSYGSNKGQYDDNPTIGNWRPFCFLAYLLAMFIVIIGFGLDLISYNYPILPFCS